MFLNFATLNFEENFRIMRAIVFISICLLLCGNTFSAQVKQQDSIQVSNNYFEKYQRQKKTANIILGTGSVLALSGFIVASTDSGTRGSLFFSTNQIVGLILIISGVTSALVSIPFYISAEKNKRKSLTIQPTFQLENEKYTQEKSAKVGVAITF